MQHINTEGPFASNFITFPSGSSLDLSGFSAGSYICRAVIEQADGQILRSEFKKLLLLK
jgi:hypothetical protein